ncbi:MAG: type II secretion system protein [Christensenellales bacterium]
MKMNNKAYTLLEVLLAVLIFSAVALPLLGVFVQAVKTDVAARNVLNANYIAQDYVEQLYSKTYKQALDELPERRKIGEYYLSASISPHGAAGDLFSSPCAFAHLLLMDNGKMLSVMPDGKWQLYGSIPADIKFGLSGGNYTLNCDGTQLAGTLAYDNCVLIVNAMKKPEASASPVITLGGGCKAIVYLTYVNKDTVSIAGDQNDIKKHVDIISGDTSLIYVKAKVYDMPDSSEPVGLSEAYISINN